MSTMTLDIIGELRTHLVDTLAEQVGTKWPATRPTRFVRLNRVAGYAHEFSNAAATHIATADISVHVYDTAGTPELWEFAGEVHDALMAFAGDDVNVARVVCVTAPRWLPDESRSAEPLDRVVMTHSITYST